MDSRNDREKVRQLYRATNPDRQVVDWEDRDASYIDFSTVRGDKAIEDLHKRIDLAPDLPSCQLFTGHTGSGKSTELFRLKKRLEDSGFYVVYIDSFRYLNMSDVDISDILLMVGSCVTESVSHDFPSESVEKIKADFEQISKHISLREIGKQQEADKLIVELKKNIIDPIVKMRQEKSDPKQGLVVIVDSLERLDNQTKLGGRPQQEYLFIDHSVDLRSLHCHIIYTMPPELRFSNQYSLLTQRIMRAIVLPLIPVRSRQDNTPIAENIAKLSEVILRRVPPDEHTETLEQKISSIFDSPETLDYLCLITGGHLRNLLRIFNAAIIIENKLPVSRKTIERIRSEYSNDLVRPLTKEELSILHHVHQNKNFHEGKGFSDLIRNLYIFEYQDQQDSWFDCNPVLEERSLSIGQVDTAQDGTEKIEKSSAYTLEKPRQDDYYDLFLGFNAEEEPLVESIQQELSKHQISVLSSRNWQVPSGTLDKVIEQETHRIKAAGVCVSGKGVGSWKDPKIGALLRSMVRQNRPVIPIYLENCPKKVDIPLFLSLLSYVDFRQRLPDPMSNLIVSITSSKF